MAVSREAGSSKDTLFSRREAMTAGLILIPGGIGLLSYLDQRRHSSTNGHSSRVKAYEQVNPPPFSPQEVADADKQMRTAVSQTSSEGSKLVDSESDTEETLKTLAKVRAILNNPHETTAENVISQDNTYRKKENTATEDSSNIRNTLDAVGEGIGIPWTFVYSLARFTSRFTRRT